MFKTLSVLKGSFALGIIFKDKNDIMVGARRGSPLAVGYGHNENERKSDMWDDPLVSLHFESLFQHQK